jgi:hypothetical protein
MTAGNRILGLLIVGGLLVLVAPWLLACLAPLGLDVQGLPDPERVYQENERSQRLDAQREPALRRIRDLDAIIPELIEGRLTLAEASRRLRAGQDDNPGFWAVVRQAEPGTSEEERLYRHLVRLAGEELASQPERARSVRLRLEAELRALLGTAPRSAAR